MKIMISVEFLSYVVPSYVGTLPTRNRRETSVAASLGVGPLTSLSSTVCSLPPLLRIPHCDCFLLRPPAPPRRRFHSPWIHEGALAVVR